MVPDSGSLLLPFLESRQSPKRSKDCAGRSLLLPFLESRQSQSLVIRRFNALFSKRVRNLLLEEGRQVNEFKLPVLGDLYLRTEELTGDLLLLIVWFAFDQRSSNFFSKFPLLQCTADSHAHG